MCGYRQHMEPDKINTTLFTISTESPIQANYKYVQLKFLKGKRPQSRIHGGFCMV